jgi:hypothetical protein
MARETSHNLKGLERGYGSFVFEKAGREEKALR